MMQIVKRWRVEVTMRGGRKHVVWIDDNFAANVLRKLADIRFSENGVDEPVGIAIGEVAEARQTGHYVSQEPPNQ
jgi:hypothetical protein